MKKQKESNRYSESFKRAVIEEYLSSGTTKVESLNDENQKNGDSIPAINRRKSLSQ